MCKNFTPLSFGKEEWHKPIIMSTVDGLAVWKCRELHDQFYKVLTDPDIDKSSSVPWLQHGNPFGKTDLTRKLQSINLTRY